MAAIQNDRDIILQATSPRVIPVLIPIDGVEGLPGRLNDIDSDISTLGTEVNSLMGNTQDLSIRVSSLTVDNSTNTTLTVVRKNGISGTVSWTVFAGVATLSGTGDSRTIAGNSISGSSVTVKAAIGSKEVFATINKVGALASQNTVSLSSQVTGQLSSGNVSGLGALALLNTVNLNTQTTGALNGQTQVTNLGTLAYANAIAANQIGAGTLAAGVIYSGTINANKINAGTLAAGVIYSGTISANKITSGTLASGVIYAGNIDAENITSGSFYGKNFSGGMFTGSVFRTGTGTFGERLELGNTVSGYYTSNIAFYDSSGGYHTIISTRGSLFRPPTAATSGITGSVRINYNSSYNGLELEQTGGSKSPLVFLYPTTSTPSPVNGGAFMHSTHGLCISDGSKWLKTTWTPI